MIMLSSWHERQGVCALPARLMGEACPAGSSGASSGWSSGVASPPNQPNQENLLRGLGFAAGLSGAAARCCMSPRRLGSCRAHSLSSFDAQTARDDPSHDNIGSCSAATRASAEAYSMPICNPAHATARHCHHHATLGCHRTSFMCNSASGTASHASASRTAARGRTARTGREPQLLRGPLTSRPLMVLSLPSPKLRQAGTPSEVRECLLIRPPAGCSVSGFSCTVRTRYWLLSVLLHSWHELPAAFCYNKGPGLTCCSGLHDKPLLRVLNDPAACCGVAADTQQQPAVGLHARCIQQRGLQLHACALPTSSSIWARESDTLPAAPRLAATRSARPSEPALPAAARGEAGTGADGDLHVQCCGINLPCARPRELAHAPRCMQAEMCCMSPAIHLSFKLGRQTQSRAVHPKQEASALMLKRGPMQAERRAPGHPDRPQWA